MKNKSIWNEMKPYLIISFGMLVSVVELQVLLLYYSICSKFR